MKNETYIHHWVEQQLNRLGYTVLATKRHPANLIEESNGKTPVTSFAPELHKALHTASKSTKGIHYGKLDFAYQIKSNDRFGISHKSHKYLVLIETKKDESYQVANKNNSLILRNTSTENYVKDFAENGAVWYARCIQRSSNSFPKIFAIGISGDEYHHKIRPYYVLHNGVYKKLSPLINLNNFTSENIDEYFRTEVMNEPSYNKRQSQDLHAFAGKLHRDIRDTVSLSNEQKAPLVAGILLAINSGYLNYSNLQGHLNTKDSDGFWILHAIDLYLGDKIAKTHGKFSPEEKRILETSFKFINVNTKLYTPLNEQESSMKSNIKRLKTKISQVKRSATKKKYQKQLNRYNDLITKSPLHIFTDEIRDNAYTRIKNNEDVDSLGNFYDEFVKYNNKDGHDLGMVLTPGHITNLMAKLINVTYGDNVLDPVAGSGTFLISSMSEMQKSLNKLHLTEESKDEKNQDIMNNHLYGIENDDLMYSIAVSNMIMRGDGNSNIKDVNCFSVQPGDITITGSSNHPYIDKILMNPPYHQGKSHNQGEPEVDFIKHALRLLHNKGLLAAIIPMSVILTGGKNVSSGGKNPSETKFGHWKKWIYNNCKILDVITVNPHTFYPTNTQTAIIILEKYKNGNFDNNTKLINFTDDGFKLMHQQGLTSINDQVTESKYNRLINVAHDQQKDPVPNGSFIQRVQLTPDNDWLFSAHYTNPHKPTNNDFERCLNKFLDFKCRLLIHGKKDLFTNKSIKINLTNESTNLNSLLTRHWVSNYFKIRDLFNYKSFKVRHSKNIRTTKYGKGIPYISRTSENNGTNGFVDVSLNNKISKYQDIDKTFINPGKCIAFGSETHKFFYHNSNTIAGRDMYGLYSNYLNKYTAIFLITVLSKALRGLFSFGAGMIPSRIMYRHITLPITKSSEKSKHLEPDYKFMEDYIKSLPFSQNL